MPDELDTDVLPARNEQEAPGRPLDDYVIVVPMLDEAPALPSLLAELRAAGLLGHTLFVDNGSRDGSPDIVRAAGGRAIGEPRRGYGFACLAGVREAHAGGVRVAVFMECDGTDDPAQVAGLVAPVLAGDADLVVGSRRRAARGGGMPFHQRMGNHVAAAALRLLYGLRLPDDGPFRAVRIDMLQELHMEARAFAWTTEMVVKAHLRGARILWHDTGYRRRVGRSKIGGSVGGTLRASRDILVTLVRLRLSPHRDV
jgi:glycosyltransferase involved in cell wall biosynthesis